MLYIHISHQETLKQFTLFKVQQTKYRRCTNAHSISIFKVNTSNNTAEIKNAKAHEIKKEETTMLDRQKSSEA